MEIILDLKLHSVKYYENEIKCNSQDTLIINEIPEISYLDWVDEKIKLAKAQNLKFIVFKSNTFLANNYIGQSLPTKQPLVLSTLEVLKSLQLTNDFNYLNIYAGGNSIRVMPFYNVLNMLKKLKFHTQLVLDYDKPIFAHNITTIDSASMSRSRFKINYLDLVVNKKYDVILGAVKPRLFKTVREKALKEAKRYVILYTATLEKVNCTTIYSIGDYNFYVWDMKNSNNLSLKKNIKQTKISELDYIEIRRISNQE